MTLPEVIESGHTHKVVKLIGTRAALISFHRSAEKADRAAAFLNEKLPGTYEPRPIA